MASKKRNERIRTIARYEASFRDALSRDRRRRKSLDADVDIVSYLPKSARTAETAAEASRLVAALRRTKVLDQSNVYETDAATRPLRFGVAQLASVAERWVREPETWTPRSHNAKRQFSSLARHLLCRYEVPRFMDEAWFEPNKAIRRTHQSWFIKLGAGGNIRRMKGLPGALSRRAAHLFMTETPAGTSIRSGFRRAQLRAIGADRRLTDAFLGSNAVHDFDHEVFWMSFVRFCMDHPMLDRALVGPMVDYIDRQRHGGRGVDPPQPGFSMRGRTPDTLLRQVDAWHRDIHRIGMRDKAVKWHSCGIPGLDRTEGRGEGAVRHTILELVNSGALLREGREMRHCVGTYASSCARHHMAVYAMWAESKDGVGERLTVAIDPKTRRIVEARRRCNAMPKENQMRLLRIWAQEANLSISSYL